MNRVGLWNVIGPVFLSAFSLFLTFLFVQPVALFFDPSYSLHANRGVGKIVFTILVITHIIFLIGIFKQSMRDEWIQINFLWIKNWLWVKSFIFYFFIFYCVHWALFQFFLFNNYATFDAKAFIYFVPKIGSLFLGFFATFFLAWSEESIFRGTLYPLFCKSLNPFLSMFLASFIFSLAHNVTNPLVLVTTQWQLGLGLFLLGFFLNLVFAITKKLYISMAIHAGLVFVKVFLRRIPCVIVSSNLPWYLHADLRQSFFIHVIFFLVISYILFLYRKNL